MDNKRLDFFLGALTPTGFAGYHAQLTRDTKSNIVLIKGCPGCGKSTIIKRIAEFLLNNKEQVELIHCAADPDSYDSVICKNLKFTIADATPPHTMEPEYPVAFEQVLPLYYCINAENLQKHRKKIIELFNKHDFLTQRTTRYLAAAGSLLQDTCRTAQTFTNSAKIYELAKTLSKKYIPSLKDKLPDEKQDENKKHAFILNQSGAVNLQEDVRMLSAVTFKGIECYAQTVLKLADNIILIDDPYGYASKSLLSALRQEAIGKGQNLITCYCSMNPYDKIEHVILPQLRLAFVTCNSYHCENLIKYKTNKNINIRTIHSTRFCNKDGMNLRKKRLQFNKKATEQLLLQAQLLMKQTKQCHDELESYYINAADFPALDRAFDKIVAQLSEKK